WSQEPPEYDAAVDRDETRRDASDGVRERQPDRSVHDQAVCLEREGRERRVGAEKADGQRDAQPRRDREVFRQNREQQPEHERTRNVDDEGAPRERARAAAADRALELVPRDGAEGTGDR